MSIDKTWINNSNKFSDEYVAGAFAFVERAQQFVDTRGLVKCPCNKCINIELQTIGVLESHLFENGFLRSYTNWYWHGEEEIIPTNRVVHQCHEDEMMDVLNDIAQPNNCEDDENEVDDEIPPASECRGTSQYYNDLFAEMESPLFPGCEKYTSLNFVAKLMHFKVLGKIPNKIFDGILELLEDAFPSPNKIPKSHYAAKRLMRKLGLGYESIHVCKHDCALFWKENAGKHKCPICGEDRWVDKNTKGKKVPQKVMRYFPLTPQLMRKYASRHISQHMRWHHEGRVKEDGIMRHPADGKAWKDFDRSNLAFAMEPRNVRLGLAADGFNPFGNMSLSYSMWPVVLMTYNLPPWLCMKETNFMLTLLIPGPHSPGKDFDVFLRPLVDELKELWVSGVQTRDIVDGSFFKLRAALLWTINDFPARSSFSGWSGQGYTACPTCNVSTPSVRLQNKVAFYGHRNFLPMGHQIRKKKKLYGSVEKRPPPEEFSTEAIFTQMNFMPESLPVKFPDGFASNLRKNVIENDNKITGLKSHDCHVILQRLLPIGVHSFLEKPIAKTIIDLCTFFKIICARTLIVSDLEKVKTSIVEILCGLEIIFPPAFFDVMVHLMIHLPQEAIDGGPVHMRWMYPFERYMKKLKHYVRNKARPEGSIAEGYVVDEALTFCSMYFKGVETRFNRPDRNVDAIPSLKKLSVFQSQGCPIGKKTLTTLDDELKKTAEWYILNNCIEILPYIQEHKQILLSSGAENLDQLQKKEFPMWFYNKLYNLRQAGSAEASEELFSLANGSSNLVSSYTGYPTKSRMKHENNITSIFTKFEWYKNDKFILATQAKQIFYLDDLKNDRDWKIVEEVHHRNVWDTPAAYEQLDPIEIDVMHDTITSDFQLFVDLGPLPEINFCRRDQSPYVVNVDTPVDQEEGEEEEEEEMVDEEEEEMVDEEEEKEEEEEMDLEEDNVEENENDSDNEYYSDD
ncbi:uncharacterized protein LOC133792583 [Humulus lupulus]|uniref:uncharacterized protein LOC133792583 n=1 Tax=Humulus lupulus TaxID=3486 RepID=UPI002B4076F1|nr:uncharacterized protein LOC133792583 [Humulus lupulus]